MGKQKSHSLRAMVCSHDPQVFNHINMCITKNIGHDVMLKVEYSGVGKPLMEDGWGCGLDVLFVDINLQDADFLALARKFHRQNPDSPLILLIDEPKQAIRGYEMHTFMCLLKNNLYTELENALQDIRNELGIDRDMLDFHFIDKLFQVYADEVLYVESQEHNITVHFRSKFRQPCHLFSTLTKVDKMLRPHGFYRISQSFIVNIAYVDKLTHEWVTLANGLQLPMGEHRFQEGKALHKAYIESRGSP